MKIELTREEFDIISNALDFTVQEFTKRKDEMHRNLEYSGRREKTYNDIIESTRKVAESKFDPAYYEENLKALEEEEFILATLATENWELANSTIRKAIFDGRIKENERKKEGRDWKVSIAAMKRLYGEPKHKIKWNGFGEYY